MVKERTQSRTWWGTYEVDEGEGGFFYIGSLRLWMTHQPGEWRIAVEHGQDPLDEHFETRCPTSIEEVPEGVEVGRYATRHGGNTLSIAPVLADRSVVARPEVPFHLLPGDEANLFISTSVWVRLSVGDPATMLMEVPTVRSSDTWFGPSTREGELCYSSRTAARMNLENVPRRPGRAITSVSVRNRADDNLLLERLSLPVPALSLFSDDEGGNLWTETVTVERDREGHMAEVRLGRRPPGSVKNPKRVSSARSPEGRNVLVKALNSLLR